MSPSRGGHKEVRALIAEARLQGYGDSWLVDAVMEELGVGEWTAGWFIQMARHGSDVKG